MISSSTKYSKVDSVKINEINYTGAAGLGFEWFMFKFFSIQAEAMFDFTLSKYGNIMYPYANITGNVYFDIPFFLNN